MVRLALSIDTVRIQDKTVIVQMCTNNNSITVNEMQTAMSDMFTLTEKERNCTWLHSDSTKLFVFSTVKVSQLLLQPTSQHIS